MLPISLLDPTAITCPIGSFVAGFNDVKTSPLPPQEPLNKPGLGLSADNPSFPRISLADLKVRTVILAIFIRQKNSLFILNFN